MYAAFLQLALDRLPPSDGALTTGEAVIKLHQCRGRLAASRVNEGTPALLAEELNYDVALISLAQLLEIAVNVHTFDQPLPERSRLERAIETTGIDLYQIGGSSPERPAGDSA